MSKDATFVLYKSPRLTADGSEYVGHVLMNGKAYAVEAKVVDHHFPPWPPGKHFEGKVYNIENAVQRMFRGATLTGDKAAIPQYVLDLLEPPPFDDPLPNFVTGDAT